MSGLTLAGFDSGHALPEVARRVVELGLSGAPFFDRCLTRRLTSKSSVTFPVADPTGGGWTAELAEIGTVNLNDDAVVVTPARIAGIVRVSRESVSDSELNVTSEVGRLVAGSLATVVDRDILGGNGTPVPEPTGLLDGLTPVDSGDSLLAATIRAMGQMYDAGGNPTHLALTGDMWARQGLLTVLDRLSEIGTPFANLGLEVVLVPGLPAGKAVLLDKSHAFGVVRNDYEVDLDTSGEAFRHNAVDVRVQARVAGVVLAPAKSMRVLTVSGEEE